DAGNVGVFFSLPSEILPDGLVWSPRGDRLVFLARTGTHTALCLVCGDGSGFRYLTDLDANAGITRPFPPIHWAPGGQAIVYAKSDLPSPSPGGWLFGASSTRGPTNSLFVDDLTGQPSRLVIATGGGAPGWELDGSIVTLDVPDRAGPLLVRAFRPN